ncbi:hypothetical protein L596_019342 [Steinernema carpocapsae]|uniref:Uncharacterized protein n=1 Tax=Steinernema carpocapsae TaxID=34508 RepID=A0A4U5MR51_STECR|nr:hypothetical protein L596_019342 [Steinernema carpocapsae]
MPTIINQTRSGPSKHHVESLSVLLNQRSLLSSRLVIVLQRPSGFDCVERSGILRSKGKWPRININD